MLETADAFKRCARCEARERKRLIDARAAAGGESI
jgi:hypothetical protein